MVWAIGCDSRGGGHSIYRYSNSQHFWQKANNGGAVRIAVSDTGTPWVANNNGTVYWRSTTDVPPRPSNSVSSGDWQATNSNALANDIGVSSLFYPWIIGKDAAAGGFNIWLYDTQPAGAYGVSQEPSFKDEWLKIQAGAVAISVGPNARPWVVANDGTIWRMKP